MRVGWEYPLTDSFIVAVHMHSRPSVSQPSLENHLVKKDNIEVGFLKNASFCVAHCQL